MAQGSHQFLKAARQNWGKASFYAALFGFLLAVAVIVRIWDPDPVSGLRNQAFDYYQRILPREAAALPVLVVDLDDSSLKAYGQWPWPRTLLSELTKELFKGGVAVVAFDILFAEPDRLSPDLLADTLPGLTDDARQVLKNTENSDALFAETIAKARVVLAQAPTVGSGEPAQIKPVSPQAAGLAGPTKAAIAEVGGDPRPYLLSYGQMIRSLPELEESAAGLGSVALSPERDGTTRRVPLLVRVGENIVPGLIIEMLRVATGQNAIAVKSNKAGIDSIIVGGVQIPTDRHGRKWVHFSPFRPDLYISAKDVLSGDAPAERLKGKLVLVGSSATALMDIKTTPLGPTVPGVEIHAQLLEAILSHADLVRPNYALGAELTILVLTCLFVVVLTPLLGALVTLLLGSLIFAGLAGASGYLFVSNGTLIDVSYTAIVSLSMYGIATYLKYVNEELQRKSVRRAFSQYLSPDLIDELASDPARLRLGGEAREMTILFADIKDFTTISERLTAQDVTQVVNRILTGVTESVLSHRGTIDKYIGDCAMAFWNAPLPDREHARNACMAALDMLAAIEALNTEGSGGRHEGSPDLGIGIGLNTGECFVGNMGSEQRFNYSVLGDTVNLASRLEAQTRIYGCPIIVGQETAVQAHGLAFLELDNIRVKGKTQEARAFALLGDDSLARSAGFLELQDSHGRLLTALEAQDWYLSKELLAACRARAGTLPLERVYNIYAQGISDGLTGTVVIERYEPPELGGKAPDEAAAENAGPDR